MAAKSINNRPAPRRRYAILEESPNFSVVVWQVGAYFKLSYRDTRDERATEHVIFTKQWVTQSAADEYIKLYSQLKGRTINDSSNCKGKSGQRGQAK
jgi:hypothetical protein